MPLSLDGVAGSFTLSGTPMTAWQWMKPYPRFISFGRWKRMAEKRRPQLSRGQIIRLGRLLHMKYRPSEIAEIIGVSDDTVRRSYLKSGCPYEQDGKGRIWIIGTAFRSWAEDILEERKRKKHPPMKENEAWCFKCNKRVKIQNPKVKHTTYHLELIQGYCKGCRTKVNRARSRKAD